MTEVMAYYFPQWHRDPVNDALHDPGWTEWSVVKAATPRFPGHVQPKKPLWGYADESDPAHGSKIVDAALGHGLTGFIVDWYWFDNQPFLNGGLDRGLLGASRAADLKFALMWANHEWTDLYPAAAQQRTLLESPNSLEQVEGAFEHIIDRYLRHPSYWRISDAAYFSIYDVPTFAAGLGGMNAAATVLARFRDRARTAGAGNLHLNAATNFQIADPASMATRLGLDSITHYTWWHHRDSGFDTFPTTPYPRAHARARQTWREFLVTMPVAYVPNVTVGWDPTPRTMPWPMDRERGYPYTSVLVGNSPPAIGSALRDAIEAVATAGGPQVVTINAWNEWTEGSYLEPDEEHGFEYLKHVQAAIDGSRAEERSRR
jgi:Glycosyltransferase WbsX